MEILADASGYHLHLLFQAFETTTTTLKQSVAPRNPHVDNKLGFVPN